MYSLIISVHKGKFVPLDHDLDFSEKDNIEEPLMPLQEENFLQAAAHGKDCHGIL